MLTDFHTHSNNSFDSKESLIDMCNAAINSGISHLALTEHFSLDNNKKSSGHLDYSKYYAEINEARHKFRGKLDIALGLELCEPHLDYVNLKETLKNYKIDFLLGSVHNINDKGLRTTASNLSAKDTYTAYFEEIYKMVSIGEFNCCAHLDLINRYALDIHGDYNLKDFEEYIYASLKILIQRGKGIEINTSGLRNDLNSLHPKVETLKMYKALGGEIITIGSDAHKKEDVAKGCLEATELIKSLGFKYIFTFKELKPYGHALK